MNNDNKKEHMYDITVNSEGHRFYSNGILSHNSTSYTVYCLWYVITHKQKNILICANKFKTAKDILSRIRLAYMKLPNWLKPGIVTWSASEISFDNGCKITAEATSENSGRGGSINCLVLDEFAFLEPSCFDGDTPITLRNAETGEIIETTVEKAKELIEEYV